VHFDTPPTLSVPVGLPIPELGLKPVYGMVSAILRLVVARVKPVDFWHDGEL
jgi:hypothetical protein